MEIKCSSDPGSIEEHTRKHLKVFVTKNFENVHVRGIIFRGSRIDRARAVITPNSNGESYYEYFEIRALKIKRETNLQMSLTEDTANRYT